ncbi:MAG: lysine--tRNA ligase [Elusimicrobia bacterium GWA2_69_24]|nr:MAG: lysine--tRNA ligase [Elusimicrobia bacterium GWA2_69_24]HBL16600.1 lysine--tRNA ligase [Elusimicrobiota bacterium]
MELELLKNLQDKALDLRRRGIDLYPHRWPKTHSALAAAALGADLAPEGRTDQNVRVAGRIVQMRVMGKASFAHLLDNGVKIQIYLKKDVLGPAAYDLFRKDLHVGDFLGVAGLVFKTKTGETTVEAATITVLAKSLRPLPEKWHGLKDTDTRYRRRYLDLLSNPEVRKVFETRSRLVESIRKTFSRLGYLEVETPVLLSQAGGAAATPFKTHHRALDIPLFLRIATELYLKRLIIGGFDGVYEIGRIFRNEGIDTRHNPEFTMLEAYKAYSDYNGMAELFENIVGDAAETLGTPSVEYRGKPINLKPPFRRLRLPELWKEHCGADIHDILQGKGFNPAGLTALAARFGIDAAGAPPAKIFERIFDEKLLPNLHEPAFIMDHPTAITPLAKCLPGDESLVERFEFFMGTEEIANAYSELNDPIDQRERFEEQARQKAGGQEDADVLDEDFLEAMEHGMPPTGGIGIGIDRLAMVFTGNPSIREVVLFPTLKPESA